MAAVEQLRPRVTVSVVVPPPAVTSSCSASMSSTSPLAMLAPELTVIVVCAAVMLALRVVVISTVAPLAWLTLDDPLKNRVTVNDVVPPPAVTLICSLSISSTSPLAMPAPEATVIVVTVPLIAALSVVVVRLRNVAV